jgi:hypothetical protein
LAIGALTVNPTTLLIEIRFGTQGVGKIGRLRKEDKMISENKEKYFKKKKK